jgi:hypothetical protein
MALDLTHPAVSDPASKEGTRRCRSGATLIKFCSTGREVEGLTLGGASLIKFKFG